MAREDEGTGSFVSCLRRGPTSPRRQTRPGQAPGSGKGKKGQVWGRHAEYWRIQIHCGEWTWVGSLRGLSSWLSGKESACDAEDASDATGSIPGLGKSLGEGHGNPLQYSCLGESHGHSNLVGHSPWGRTESDTTKATQGTCTSSLREFQVSLGQRLLRCYVIVLFLPFQALPESLGSIMGQS